MAVAEAFQMSKCECKLVDLLALAALWDEAVMLLKDCRISLFAFLYLHRKNVLRPSSYRLIGGLCESSASFGSMCLGKMSKELRRRFSSYYAWR